MTTDDVDPRLRAALDGQGRGLAGKSLGITPTS